MKNKINVGWIGLGAMGWHMASNLARADSLNYVWNRSVDKSKHFAEEKKVSQAVNLQELAAVCELIFICVSADEDLLEVVSEMKPILKAGSIIVDHSTVSAGISQTIANELSDLQVKFLDAPVSGGVEGAKNASLSMMVGGDESVLLSIMPVLNNMATKIVYMGASGNGQATKAVNQIMAAGINQAVSEALAFGEAMQLDMKKVIDVVGGGAAANWFLANRGNSMVDGSFDAGFKVGLHHKDLNLCKRMMADVTEGDKSLPIVEMTLIHYQRLITAGFGEDDISSLYRLKKELFKPDE